MDWQKEEKKGRMEDSDLDVAVLSETESEAGGGGDMYG